MNSSTAINLTIGELLSVLGVALGVLFFMGRLLVAQVAASLRAQISGLSDSTAKLEREVELLNRSLPLEYVRREDWIRFSSSIDSKLDRLHAILMSNKHGGGE
jgi:hypothetical protein